MRFFCSISCTGYPNSNGQDETCRFSGSMNIFFFLLMKNQNLLFAIFWFLWLQPLHAQENLTSKYDVHQYILDLEISNLNTFISGNVTMKATVTASLMDTAVIELIDSITNNSYMIVDSVKFNEQTVSFQHTSWMVKVPLSVPVLMGDPFSLQIFYHGNGSGCNQSLGNGIFRKTLAGMAHTYATSQPFYAKFWWPCKDIMTDKADSLTFIITTDSTNHTASNGLLRSIEWPGNGKARYTWATHYPVSTYLVSFVTGPQTIVTDYALLPSDGDKPSWCNNTKMPVETDSLLLYNLLFPTSSWYPVHLRAIEKTKELLTLFGNLLGPYPFKNEKYGYAVVGTPALGMENQTFCTIGYESFDTTSVYYYNMLNHFMTAHELAHQWFGDAVICSTWNDAWLVDGFASYMEYVALENLEGRPSADAWMKEAHATVKSEAGGSVWIPDSLAQSPYSILDYRLVYKKGASIIHILRYMIHNDSLFFGILKQYIAAYQYGDASAIDFQAIAESVTGMDLNRFFEQWYYGNGYPLFDISWNQVSDTLEIKSVQTTSTELTTLFQIPFDLRIWYPGGDTTLTLFQDNNLENWHIPFNHPVDSLTFDPDGWLLQKNLVHVGIRENINTLECTLFPNPTEGNVTLSIRDFQPSEELSYTISDRLGRQMMQGTIQTANEILYLGDLAPGMYLLRIQGNKRSSSFKIIRL